MINTPRGPTDEYLRSVEVERDELRELLNRRTAENQSLVNENKQFRAELAERGIPADDESESDEN
jgi:regulator of replication initiation timing